MQNGERWCCRISFQGGGQSRNLSARNRGFTAPDRGATIGATIGAMIGATPGHRLAVDGPELSLVTRNFRPQLWFKAVAGKSWPQACRLTAPCS